jgi:hypothetical protein
MYFSLELTADVYIVAPMAAQRGQRHSLPGMSVRVGTHQLHRAMYFSLELTADVYIDIQKQHRLSQQ